MTHFKKTYSNLVLLLVISLGCKDHYERQIIIDDKVVAIIFEDDGKQGLKDTLGNILLPARFDYIEDFIECGVIKVDSGGSALRDGDVVEYQPAKIGLIDFRGNVILEPQYDDIVFNWFPLGLVRKGDRYGYIDNKGVVRISLEYLNATPFREGFAVVKTQTGYGLIDSANSFIIQPDNDSLELNYATGFSRDTMLIVINNHEKTLMINKHGTLFDVIAK